MSANLNLFFDPEPPFVFDEAHITLLTQMWKKYGRDHSMADFNAKYHTSLLRKQPDADLLYRANLGIPVYSELARKVAVERGLL